MRTEEGIKTVTSAARDAVLADPSTPIWAATATALVAYRSQHGPEAAKSVIAAMGKAYGSRPAGTWKATLALYRSGT